MELLQVSLTLSQFVKIRQQDFTGDGSLIATCRSLQQEITDGAILRIGLCLSTKKQDQIAKLRAFSYLENRNKTTVLIWMVKIITVKQYSRQWMGCYQHFCSCQESCTSLTDQAIERGNKKKGMDEMRREYIKEKGYKIEEMWECEC